MLSISSQIAAEITARVQQVDAAIQLLDEGSTVPFIARYRKEATGGLDDTQLRSLEQRLSYLRELDARKQTILQSIESQGKLKGSLKDAILSAENKTSLEDLYLPYKPKRRTRAQIAREAGLEPLLEAVLSGEKEPIENLALAYLNPEKGLDDIQKVLEGARNILIEKMSETAALIQEAREYCWRQAVLKSNRLEKQGKNAEKYRDYYDYQEAVKKIPSHRVLALFRGRADGVLDLQLTLPNDPDGEAIQTKIEQYYPVPDSPASTEKWIRSAYRLAWKTKLHLHITVDLFSRIREAAEDESIKVFGANLKDLLLTAPAGQKNTLGIDPGLRTGIKLAVVNHTGSLLETQTLYPHAPKNQWSDSIQQIIKLCNQYQIKLVAIGNGTASRETERLVLDVMKAAPELQLTKVVVSEAGASVYSASALAAQEFPDVDVSLRGAVSIARRLQDPLAELVKIPPQSIGVGQYQHDVNQVKLGQGLSNVVEDCVNVVGVNINTASSALLASVAGLSHALADNICQFRAEKGAFKNRKEILQVPMLGQKRYQQAAGFLRILDGDQPLDASAVHPEAYPLVEQLLMQQDKPLTDVLGNSTFLKGLNPEDFVSDEFGLPTVRDVIAELDKPGLDPRGTFKTVRFQDGIESLTDLVPDMLLEGVITNVTNFGAFVDIGVHQDGLVHISQLTKRYIKDPREVVKAGQIVKVTVVEVDLDRKRIALSMLLDDTSKADKVQASESVPKPKKRNRKKQNKAQEPAKRPAVKGQKSNQSEKQGSFGSALAEAFKKAQS